MASKKNKPPSANHNLRKLQETYDLCVRCSRCCKGKTNISYDLVALAHQCPRNILLARQKGNKSKWRPVTQRPKFPRPSWYKVCQYLTDGKGCTLHGDRCAYARSTEEAAVWNFMMKAQLEFTQLIKLLPNGSTFPTHQENQAPAPGCVEVVQEILSKFQGTFVELCKNCFHDSPRKITLREQGTPCTGHSWSPILVFCQKGDKKRVVYDEIRPLPKRNIQRWRYCRYVENGEPCWHGAHRCWFAHSHIEMAVWKLESKGSLDRSHLLHASQRRQSQSSGASSRSASRERERQHYCHVCKCQFPSNEEFMNHCFSVKHKKLIFGDSSYTWKFREPPLEGKVFKLCERSTTCEYGDSCMDAHSVEELQEWRCRHKAVRKKARAAEEQGLLSYQDSLLEEYRRSSNKEAIIEETLPDVSVSCDSDLNIFVRQKDISHRWKFTVKSKVALYVVALMRQDVGATFSLGKDIHDERSYSNGVWFDTHDGTNTQKVYEITVSFTSDHPGFYEQWLVLDFDMRPVLLQKLKVTVGEQPPERVQDNDRYQQSIDSAYSATETESVRYTEQVWQEGTVEMVPYFEMTEAERQLLNRYRQTNRQLSTETTEPGSITRQNYKKKMHHFLYQEEMEQEKLIRRCLKNKEQKETVELGSCCHCGERRKRARKKKQFQSHLGTRVSGDFEVVCTYKQCICNGSFYPQDFTLDSLDQELLELSNMIKTEEDDSSDDESVTSEIPDITEDPILKELLNEDNDLQIQLTEEGLFPVLQADNLDNNLVRHLRKEGESSRLPSSMMLQDNSNIYKCELYLKRYDSGYAVSYDDPTMKIAIKARRNVGQAFSGDVVSVEVLTPETSPPQGKVIKVLKHSALSKEFVCTIDNNDDQLMTPINICIPKLFTPFWKDKPYHIAVRNSTDWSVERFIKINEEARRNNLFVVRFLKWREGFTYPLGIVVQVLPRVTSLEDGMKVLEKEYQLKRTVSPPVQKEMQKIKKIPLFTKGREDFRELLTFTIDASTSQDLDDAISVRDLGQCYEIGIHIADVASFVAKDSELDKYARQQGTSFYISEGEPTHMFPNELSTKDFSLLPGCERRCISLLTKVDKQTHRIQRRSFFKSVIRSNRRFSYEEAEEILRRSGDGNDFHTLEGCLAIACHFAEIHVKDRKQDDWCYKSPDEDTVLGKRRSHRLVEELMIMFNHTVADRLLSDNKTRSLTPLRCQDRPNRKVLCDFVDKNASLLPMSIHLSSQLDHVSESLIQQNNHSESFPILASVLNSLKIAAQDEDIHSIVDLITTDDIHPLLLPLIHNMKKHLNKSLVLRANSAHLARLGHYDLVLDSYTWASSPIRRYVDVIVQRLLHSVLDNTKLQYNPNDIDLCCVDFTQKNTNQSSCQKKSDQLSLASKLSCQNARKVAYIVEAKPTGNNFRISFPLNSSALPGTVGIMYRDLQLVDQPCFNEEDDCMVLRWKRRVYSVSNPRIHADLKLQQPNSVITHVPTESWKNLVSAIREEKWQYMVQVIEQMNSVQTRQASRRNIQIPPTASRMEIPNQIEEHYLEMSMKLKQGQNIEVQLGTDTVRGLLVPAVQLLIVNPKFEICLDHTKNPIVCFSKYALCSSRDWYNTYMDYQKIWKPLCEMESAGSAVAENESIVIEDAELKWKKSKERLEGSFQLPLEKKEQWAIKANLNNCFLCIRLRIQQKNQSQILQDLLSESQNFNLMDVPGLIWIAHGVVTNVTIELTYIQIDFRINHMPMTNIPDQIFCESARFTVELIPKLLPDVRKENAIQNLTKANHLVKAIATGKNTRDQRTKIPTCNRSRFEIENHLHFGFPELNNSQSKAIMEALNNEFTLIQGPPGTGKTVVGVHIVYWFFQENQKRPNLQRVKNEDKRKRCILYCGPSNKSVDVVAGQLLKLKSKLKPLRVYSDQMEILEFPYPGSNLKLSRHSKRIEKPNEELRSITLHHRIRSAENPFSDQIKAFDLKIQREQHLTDEELKSYKDCLNMARQHELLQHDVIVCTCTASPHPLLAKVLNFHQIIIDECAMATEPEAFIPLVAHKPKQIVLLGDHKQLQPVVHCELLQRLGMRTSLFERYMRKALMLDTQYRMQEDICAFPSEEFYQGRLKTGIPYTASVFMTSFQNSTSIIFGHVEGKEQSLVVSTERGNENSKANIEEAEEAVRIAKLLMNAGIAAKDIAILTPYNAQVAKINEILLYNYSRQNITVNTIMKSQGSEWRYVILSTVRSCPALNIEIQPTKSWLRRKLGFIMNPNQVNVGITRAQEGLCIIG
ncbi:hypothetical protein NFI96_031685, partial [Prochilodus magdalenae]